MKINRERLLLVTVLVAAAAACTSKATNDTSSDAGGTTVDAGGKDTSSPVGTYDASKDSAPFVEVGDADLLGGWDGGCLGNTGGDFSQCAPFETVVAEGGEPIEAVDGGEPCVTLDFCESISALNTAVGSQALACESHDPTTGCTRTTPCVLAALSVACKGASDGGAPTTCAPIVSACADAGVSDGGAAPITEAACEQLVSGFNSSTILTFASCLATSCNVNACISSLFTP